jgi:AraC-like DNA-binding protein
MALHLRQLASGDGWRVDDVICTAGPRDRAFEEQHTTACIALVTHGTFQYRSGNRAAVLAPGTMLLGNQGQWFECGHEHAAGDRCLSFHFSADCLERIAAGVPGLQRATFGIPALPPLGEHLALRIAAAAAREDTETGALEELAVRLAGAVFAALSSTVPLPSPGVRDERRITALRRIEMHGHRPALLSDLARDAAMSPFHFLRTFRAVVGMTPHQFLLQRRLHDAATRLVDSDQPISSIAYDTGFTDLSTFNRRFRRVLGESPGAYRARRKLKNQSPRAQRPMRRL